MPGNVRKIRKRLHELLGKDRPEAIIRKLSDVPLRLLINPVISFFYSGDEKTRWNAIRLFGRLMAGIADEDMESARVIMRRLMWSLNDESGGIDWGAPEAMAEAMANQEGLAEEYARILLSYIREDGNFLEHTPLRQGALWGIMRLSEVRPALLNSIHASSHLKAYLTDKDPASRNYAEAALSNLSKASSVLAGADALTDSEGPFAELVKHHKM